ncbi:hypothetical protein BC833DRAFT_546591 [Globomyces pollinis-pini]|nr:hypothetical protein BC833DRAFT_546591 [Globomyces pollinis-pini]
MGICLLISILISIIGIKRYSYKKITDWSKEIVVITGGSNGIGNLCAQKLQELGATVIVIDKLKPKQKSLKYYQCDLTDVTKIHEVCLKIIKNVDHPTMLVNNVGIIIGKKLMEATTSEVDLTMKVNCLSHLYIIKAFLPGFIKANRGHILSVSSVMGLVGAAYSVDYSASKFAITGYAESLRQELNETNVHMSCLFPGLITTGMFLGVSHSLPWITPPLTPNIVAVKMVDMLESNYSQDVHMPFYAKFLPLIRFLPVEINDWIHIVFGSNTLMKDFKGSLSTSKENK